MSTAANLIKTPRNESEIGNSTKNKTSNNKRILNFITDIA